MIGVCTDSNSQIPTDLARRLGIAVVPLTVRVDGVDHEEGVDLEADGFWDRFATGSPEVASAAPPPGRFLRAWAALAEAGADEIVSVHIGSAVSATLAAARVAAPEAAVPIHLVDTGAASFAVACAAWAAADHARAGDDAATIAAAAEAVGRSCGNVFVVGTLDQARAGGRLAAGTADSGGLPVLAMVDGQMQPLARAGDGAEAARIMADRILAAGVPLRVGVGSSDPSSFATSDLLVELLRAAGEVDVVPYRVGPSVGVHTGPGTAGAVYHRLL